MLKSKEAMEPLHLVDFVQKDAELRGFLVNGDIWMIVAHGTVISTLDGACVSVGCLRKDWCAVN